EQVSGDVDVQRVPQVAGRVIGRDVQQLEVGEVVLDLGALVDHEPELGEDPGDLGHRLDARVQGATANGPARRRDVDDLRPEARVELCRAQDLAPGADGRLDAGTDPVRHRPDLRTMLGGHPAEAPQD